MSELDEYRKRRLFHMTAFFLFILLSLSSISCSSSQPVTVTTFALDTVCQITVYREKDKAPAEEALSLLKSYEMIFSRTREDAELYRLNHAKSAPFQASQDLYAVIQDALYFSELSGGAFDITLGGVLELYHFSETDPAVPDQEALERALSHTGHQHVHLKEDGTIQIDDPECQLDLGAIAKGYIADRLKESLQDHGVESALISLGGNLFAIGEKPGNKPFILGIKYPEKASQEVIQTLEVTDASLVTSGTYERSFEKDGVLYHHILDPAAGTPVRSRFLSCSILTGKSETADALSTLCFILGPEKSADILKNFSGTRAYFVSEDFKIITVP